MSGTPLDRTSTIPLFEQIATVLQKRIESGQLPGGAQIPSEANLMTQFEVSRMTVRHAIAHLRSQGLVVARHGSGVYVHQRSPQRTIRPHEPAVAAPPSRPPMVTALEPPEQVRALLGVRKGAKVIQVLDMGRSEDGTIPSTKTYLTKDTAKTVGIEIGHGKRLTEPVLDRFTAHGLLVDRWSDHISARMPEGMERAFLQMAEGSPVLVQVRVATSADGTVLFVQEATHPSTVVLVFDTPAKSYPPRGS